jgi:hypothetical protein
MAKRKDTGLQGVDSLFKDRVQQPPPVQPQAVAVAEVSPPAAGNDTERPTPDETLRQTSVMLYDKEIDWLDQQVIEIRKRGGKGLRKTAIIRGLINLAMTAPVDLRGVKDEAELVERFEQGIKSKLTT